MVLTHVWVCELQNVVELLVQDGKLVDVHLTNIKITDGLTHKSAAARRQQVALPVWIDVGIEERTINGALVALLQPTI